MAAIEKGHGVRGVGVMMLSSVLFALMSGLVRGVVGVNAYTTVMVRFFVGAGLMGILFLLRIQELRWNNWPWIVARGVSGGLACVIFYATIQGIGLARAVMYNYTSVIWATLMAVPLLAERPSPRHWGAIAMAMAGIVLLFGVGGSSVAAGDVVALCGGILSGLAVVCVTHCRKTDSPSSIFFSQSVFGILVGAGPSLRHFAMPTLGQWQWLILIGVLAAAAQMCMTYAYKFTGASQGSVVSLLTPVLSATIGLLYFHETQGAGFFMGAGLILAACGYVSLNPVRQMEALPGCAVAALQQAGRQK